MRSETTSLETSRGDPKAAIWDMDGVIFDSAMLHFRAWQRLTRELGRSISYKQFLETFGRTNADTIEDLIGSSLSPEKMAELADRKERYFRDEVGTDARPFAGVSILLEKLKNAGYRQAVASSAPRENIDVILQKLRLTALFDAIVSADDIHHGKPDPEVFLTAAKKLGVSPQRSIVIEDAVAGVEAAKRAGMVAIAVTNSRTKNELAQADLVVASLESLDVPRIDALLSDHLKKTRRSGGQA